MPTEESKPAEWIGTFDHYMRMIPISEANLYIPPSCEKDDLSQVSNENSIFAQEHSDASIVIVTKNNRPIGYLNLDGPFWEDEDPYEILPLAKNQFLQPTTSIYKAELLLIQTNRDFFFVPRKGEPLAVFYLLMQATGTALQICAYAAVSNLEIALLSLLQHHSSEAIGLLMPPYLHDAMELYEMKRLRYKPDGGYDTHLLLGCTTFKTKMHLVRQLTCIKEIDSEGKLFTKKDLDTFNEIRNWLAHPETNQVGTENYGLVFSLRIISDYEKQIQRVLGIVPSVSNRPIMVDHTGLVRL